MIKIYYPIHFQFDYLISKQVTSNYNNAQDSIVNLVFFI